MGLFDFLKKKPDDAPASTPAAGGPAAAPASPAAPAQPASPAAPAQTPKAAPQPAAPAPAAGAPAAAPAKPAPPAVIEGVDAFGRRMAIPREEYRSRMLPELLKAHGNNPDQLVGIILQALRDGFAADVLAAANRLTVVDKDVERALSVLAVVQRDAGELDSAEATLHELLQKRPQSAAARVGLGMLAMQRGDRAAAREQLAQALERDVNHPDAVHGWLQLSHEVGGEDGYLAAMQKLAESPQAWRARLWLARHLAQKGELDRSAAAYREALAAGGDHMDAQVMASADLVQQQRHDLVRELVAPRFVPGRSHPHVGLALLHHFAQTQDHVAGAALLHQMHLHYGHLVGGELQPFTAEFDRQRLAKLPPPPALGPNARIGLYRLDRPIWYAGLDDPVWLLPNKPAGGRQALFFALSIQGKAELLTGKEDEIGRLSRSVPLLLAEQAWLSTPHRGAALLPLAESGGWALIGRPWPEEMLLQGLPERERAEALLVTGTLHVDGDMRRIDLFVYDGQKQARVGEVSAEAPAAAAGELLLRLLADLWPLLGGPKDHKPPVGDAAFWQRYAEGLGQLAALVVTQAGGMPKERLYGERYITNWLQSAALLESRWQPGFWTVLSALGVLHQLGSPVPKEHARFVAEVFRQSPANSPFARLAAPVLRAVGLEGLWQSRRAEIVAAAGGDPAYAAWLQRVEGQKAG
jgi:tetratricopeptide (TPR) repeat protein